MGLTERHFFEDEEPELTENQLEDVLLERDKAYKKGYADAMKNAVPLDKLCEWLNVHCGRPNYCNDRLCGECNLDGEGYEYETCWETLLTEWMEEQDEQKEANH